MAPRHCPGQLCRYLYTEEKIRAILTFQAYLYSMIRHKAVDEIRKSVLVILAEDEKPGQWQNAGEKKTISGKTQRPRGAVAGGAFILQEDREWLYACMRTLRGLPQGAVPV